MNEQIDAGRPGAVEIDGKTYMRDARGALQPVSTVKPQHLLEDEMVRNVFGHADELSARIRRFKGHTFADLAAFQSLLEQNYGARAGGPKGNVTFMSFDGTLKIQVQIADQLDFGPELQAAKKLVDECLVEWGAESRPELRALVNRVFNVERQQINRAELFSLLRLEIDDPRWARAMEAIRDAIRVVGTKQYVRFYRRDDEGASWEAVTINLAAA
ncbi:DUF3164 family protein [Camelimonas lactis]|uniref:Uncharacterized protein DUF3164 n=1 Tax=Camelimonas lactis TaxID=659006 RepID=A0A4R2GW36_9HYPH|nr:DUF3164 family protein [Camelimonas lactis]TCO15208.1 uncharacterized protein DUF3164 [Camelimonas lactis]